MVKEFISSNRNNAPGKASRILRTGYLATVTSSSEIFCEVKVEVLHHGADALLVAGFRLCVVKERIVIHAIHRGFDQRLE